eukprot:scaffold20429_cov143-Skeletonema_menzelii.AAC.1
MITPPGILSTRSSSLHNKEDRTQQLKNLYESRQDINIAATHTTRSSRSTKNSGVHQKNINHYMSPNPNNNKMSDESAASDNSKDEAAREITPIKSGVTKEGSSEINISPGNDASPHSNNQDQGSPNSDWPLTEIHEPGPNDCLFGRGGGTNHHPGNKKYRKMVEELKDKYLNSKRLDKPLVAMEIINKWRSMDPPGRFLKQDERTKLWSDVGDRKAREKTSQALREKAPSDNPPPPRESLKETRFEPGTLSPGRRMKPSLAREHSLGTEEPMGPNEMSLEGFSWDETDQPVVDKRGANLHNRHHHHHHPEAEPYSPYHVRHNSFATNPLPEASTANAAPPFGDPYYHHYHPHYSSPPPHHYPHPPPPPPHYQSPQGHHQYHSSDPSSAGRQREHSLQMNPLKGANTTQPAHDTFTDPNYEGQAPPPYPPPYPSYYYPPGPPPHHWGQHPPPPPPQYYPGGHPSAFTHYEAMRSPTNSSEYDDRRASGASSNHSVQEEAAGTSQDFTRLASLIRDTTEGSTLARSSSADESSGRGSSDNSIQKSHSMPLQSEGAFPSPPKNASERKKIGGESPTSKHVRKPSLLKKISGGSLQNTTPVAAPDGALRPEPVKRDTSNQPETMETKRSTKRVILSRDKSAIAKSLKEAQRQQDEAAKLAPKLGLSKAELDRNLSVEMNKLGLNSNMPQMLDRMTTTDVLGEIFDDSDITASAQTDFTGVDALAHDMYNGGSRLQSVEWDDTLNLLVEGSNESEPDPVAVNEDVAARWISGTSSHNGTEI